MLGAYCSQTSNGGFVLPPGGDGQLYGVSFFCTQLGVNCILTYFCYEYTHEK